ncbi:hypothetical protein BGW80DRAFT_1312761 [Lactifluus volemus]|nr:hypothetical protein BGW80DRAFT_1312761 [Lactifluus volemus]
MSNLITQQSPDAATFFGIPFLPEPQVPAEILSTQEADDLMGSKHAGLVDLLDVAMLPPLFRLVGYVGGRRYARTRMDLPLPICGQTKHAKTDAQLIAEAVAAFVYNNEMRRMNGLPELQKRSCLESLWSGLPQFYKIPVTRELVSTFVADYFPLALKYYLHAPVARQNRRWSEGMRPLDNRRTILSCYEAFKAIVE